MQHVSSDSATPAPTAGFLAAQLTRPVSANPAGGAPSAGGCISEISSDAIHGCDHDYAAAMKNYGIVYQQYQAYLLPDNQLPAHDYDQAATPVPAFNHLGCLNEELLEATVHSDVVSDDDIEHCGYLGWLYH